MTDLSRNPAMTDHASAAPMQRIAVTAHAEPAAVARVTDGTWTACAV